MRKPKVIFADLDGTLIKTYSNEVFPLGIWDMRFNFPALDMIRELQPKCLLIVTNQGGIEKGFVKERDFTFKMEYIIRSIREYTGVLAEYSYCTSNDPNNEFRKPNTGMIDALMRKMIKRGVVENGILSDDILMIGDASGKYGQFGDSDKKCADKAGFHYMDIDDFIKSEELLKSL